MSPPREWGGYGSVIAPARLKVRAYTVPIEGLPVELDGLRVVQVSDTHYGPFVSREYIESVVDQANRLGPDLVALTGDYVHFTPRSVEPGIELLGALRGRLGTVAVFGNHEHWEGADRCREVFDRIQIPVIDNARLFLTAEGLSANPVSEGALCIAGVGDLWEGEVSFEKAFAGVDANVPRLVLSHNPEAVRLMGVDERADLLLGGHTHGGQVAIPFIGGLVHSGISPQMLGGMSYIGRCAVIVSRGVGVAGVPLRLGVPPEIGSITLRRA